MGTCFSLLPCIIYSLPPQLVTENYFCTISPSFPLIFYDLYSINYLTLLDTSRNELKCHTEIRDKINTSRVSIITCSLKLVNIPSILPWLCCIVLKKLFCFSQDRVSHYMHFSAFEHYMDE